MLVAIYVDDLMVASNNPRKLRQLKTKLSKSFEMRDLGLLNFCLGIKFKQDTERKIQRNLYDAIQVRKRDFESFQHGKLQGSHNSTESKRKIVKEYVSGNRRREERSQKITM